MYEHAKELVYEAFRNDEIDQLFSGKGKYSEISQELNGYLPDEKRFVNAPVYDSVDTESILEFIHNLKNDYKNNGFPIELALTKYLDNDPIDSSDSDEIIKNSIAIQFVNNINRLLDSSSETDVYYGMKTRIISRVNLSFDYVWEGFPKETKVSMTMKNNLTKFINSHIMEGKDEPLGLYDYFVKIDKNSVGNFSLLKRYQTAFVRAYYSDELDKLFECDDKYSRDRNGYLYLAEDCKWSMITCEDNYHIDFSRLHTEIKELVKECPEYFTELPKKLAETLDKLLDSGKNAVLNSPVKNYYTIPYAKILFDEMNKPYKDNPNVFNLAYQYLCPETIERASKLEGKYAEEIQAQRDQKRNKVEGVFKQAFPGANIPLDDLWVDMIAQELKKTDVPEDNPKDNSCNEDKGSR